MGGKCCCCCFFCGGLGVLAWRAAADGLWFITFGSPSFSCYYPRSSPTQFAAAFCHEAEYCVWVGEYVWERWRNERRGRWGFCCVSVLTSFGLFLEFEVHRGACPDSLLFACVPLL